MTMFADLLRSDRERAGLSLEEAARRFGVTPATYRALESGERWPSWETYDRICKAFGWPQTFAAPDTLRSGPGGRTAESTRPASG